MLRSFIYLIIGLALFLPSCTSNGNLEVLTTSSPIISSIPTSTLKPSATNSPEPTVTITETPIPFKTPTSTSSITPTPSKTPHENPGLIGSLGEISEPGWWPAIPAFSPNGKMVALVSENVTLWDLDTRSLIFKLERPYAKCYTESASFNGDSSLLAASIYCVSDLNNVGGHLLVWDTVSGELLQDWAQGFANTEKLSEYSKTYPATGFAFFQNSSVVAYANANTIEIRDVRQTTQSEDLLALGDEMVATKIFVAGDNDLLFAFMNFDNDSGLEITKKYTLQIWNLSTFKLQQEIVFPESKIYYGIEDDERDLSGQFLIHMDNLNGIFKVSDLVTQEERIFPIRYGEKFLSLDSEYLLFIPYDVEHGCKLKDVELFSIDFGQIIYTFNTIDTPQSDFGEDWCYGPVHIVFNEGNTILAIGHSERLSLWDISALTNAQVENEP